MTARQDFLFFGKSIFFPKSGILAIGDLQIGYEVMLKNKGFHLPLNQLKQTIKDIEKIIDNLMSGGYIIRKIILLGDIKHHFGYDYEEKFHVRKLLEFLENKVGKNNLILIRGNHEKFDLDGRDYHDFFIDKKNRTLFLHGHKLFPDINLKNTKRIVMGHIHPAVYIHENKGVKREKYKCFLIGKWKKKESIILPSFFPLIEGTALNPDSSEKLRHNDYGEEFGIIPLKALQKFNVFIVGEDKAYDFGVLRDIA